MPSNLHKVKTVIETIKKTDIYIGATPYCSCYEIYQGFLGVQRYYYIRVVYFCVGWNINYIDHNIMTI